MEKFEWILCSKQNKQNYFRVTSSRIPFLVLWTDKWEVHGVSTGILLQTNAYTFSCLWAWGLCFLASIVTCVKFKFGGLLNTGFKKNMSYLYYETVYVVKFTLI